MRTDEGKKVAPFTGAWIETKSIVIVTNTVLVSHPSRVRGLKLINDVHNEITVRRTLHGCVD